MLTADTLSVDKVSAVQAGTAAAESLLYMLE